MQIKESKWHEIRQKDGIVSVSYRTSNRVKAFLSFLLLVVVFMSSLLRPGTTPAILPILIFAVMLFFLLAMSLLIDEYEFHVNQHMLTVSQGIFPFIKKATCDFQELKELRVVKHITEAGKKEFLELSLTYRDKTVKLGIFKNADLLRSALNKFIVEN